MKLIVGLGNPGEKYVHNRHNVGFMMVDFIVEQIQKSKIKVQNHSSKFKSDKYSNSEVFNFTTENEEVLLVKPQTFMNESGRAVKSLTTNYKSPTPDLIIVHDDLDLKLGEFKIQMGKGPKLHNGIDSIEEALGTKEFLRVRIGVDNRSSENRIPGQAYVLQNFTTDEVQKLQQLFQSVFQELMTILNS